MGVQVSVRLRPGSNAQVAISHQRMCAVRYVGTERTWGWSSVTTGTCWMMMDAILDARKKHSMYVLGALLPQLINAS